MPCPDKCQPLFLGRTLRPSSAQIHPPPIDPQSSSFSRSRHSLAVLVRGEIEAGRDTPDLFFPSRRVVRLLQSFLNVLPAHSCASNEQTARRKLSRADSFTTSSSCIHGTFTRIGINSARAYTCALKLNYCKCVEVSERLLIGPPDSTRSSYSRAPAPTRRAARRRPRPPTGLPDRAAPDQLP